MVTFIFVKFETADKLLEIILANHGPLIMASQRWDPFNNEQKINWNCRSFNYDGQLIF